MPQKTDLFSLLRALTWAALGGHPTPSETRPSPVSCHRCTVFLCNHANYSKPRERPLCEHNLLFSSYFWDSRAHTLVRNVRTMLFFRFENNLWAANGLLSEPGHVQGPPNTGHLDAELHAAIS